jgi:hypothetical protein
VSAEPSLPFAGQRRLEFHGADKIAILGAVFLLPEGSSVADQSTVAEKQNSASHENAQYFDTSNGALSTRCLPSGVS